MSSAVSTSRSAGAEGGLDRRTLVISGVVIVGSFMSILDATVVNVALNTLGRELDASLSTIQWVVSGYTLALASVIPLSGWMADRYGARQVWLGAVVAFVGGSVLCALAWSAESLIAFRVLQGVGGGILTPVGTVIIARQAGPQCMGRVMAIIGVPVMIGPIVGPLVGGLLLQSASWHWIFLLNIPFGALALYLGSRLLPLTAARRTERLDVVGVALLSPGLAGLIYGLSETDSVGDIGSPKVLGAVVTGAVLVTLFVLRSLRVKVPLVDMRLFKIRAFSASAATTFAMGTAAFGAMLLLPLYFQLVRGEDVLTTGLLTIPQALGMGISMTASGRLSDLIGAGRIVPFGLLTLLAAFGMLTQLGADTSYWYTGGAQFVMGLGMGATMMPAMSAAYSALDSEGVARATTGLQIIQRVGSTVGAALFAVILQQRIAGALPDGGGLGTNAQSAPVGSRDAVAEGLAGAFAGTFWWGVALTALAIIPALLLPRTGTASDPAARSDCHPLAGNTSSGSVERVALPVLAPISRIPQGVPRS